MIRACIIVEGEVQRVGYRDLVQKIARKLGVKGYVENLRDGSVQIICEANELVLKDFVERINVKEGLIKVEAIHIVEKSEAKGEFEFFDIKYGRLEDELGERLGTAVEYARTTSQNIKEMHEDIKGTRVDIKEMHVDLKDSIKEMNGSLKDGTLSVQGEISGMRHEMNERFGEMAKRYDAISAELVRTREELTRAVNGLLKLIEEFIRQRHGEEGSG